MNTREAQKRMDELRDLYLAERSERCRLEEEIDHLQTQIALLKGILACHDPEYDPNAAKH